MRALIAILPLMLVGCSLFPSGDGLYEEAKPLPPMQVPDSLTLPPRDNRYSIPGIDDLADLATASALGPDRRVLPKDAVSVLEKDGLRWLELTVPAEQVWNLLVAYWMEQKAPLVESDPRKGIIRTDWIQRESSASSKKKIVRDQYRMRLERAGEGSRVYVSHFATGKSSKHDAVEWTLLPSEDERKSRILNEVAHFLVTKN